MVQHVLTGWAGLVVIMCGGLGLTGCEESPKGETAPLPTAASGPLPVATSSATGTASLAPSGSGAAALPPTPPADSPARQFFSGAPPASVKLLKGYLSRGNGYAVKVPASWSIDNGYYNFMGVRKAGGAALICDGTSNSEEYTTKGRGDEFLKHVTWPKLTALAKRAPIGGRDLKQVGAPEALTIGDKVTFKVRVGHALGTAFKTANSNLYWLDIRYFFNLEGDAGFWHIYCVMGLKQGSDDDVVKEAQAIVRSIEPPMGKRIGEPRMED